MKQSKDPLTINGYISFQHIHRYLFAARKCKSSHRILDIGCGSGYGTMLLRKKSDNVIGCELELGQVLKNRTRLNYGKYICASALNLHIADSIFDEVVSFETIEHVGDGREFLDEISRVLRPGGTLICSTPNIAYTNHPPYHIKEYSPNEFFELFENQFDHIERYAQYFKVIDYLQDVVKRTLRRVTSCFIKKDSVIKRVLKEKCVLVKSIYGPIKPISASPFFVTSQKESLDKYKSVVESKDSSYYRVVSYSGDELLRIMIATAQKK